MSPNQTRSRGSGGALRAEGRSALRLLALGSSNWIPVAAQAGSLLVVTPVLLSYLGNKGFGIWSLVNSLIGFYGLLRLGIGSGILRYVPFYLQRSDSLSASKIVSSGLAAFGFIALLIVGISQVAAEPVAEFYEGGAALASLVRIIGIAAGVECIRRILESCVRAHEAWLPANLVEATTTIVHGVGLVACVYAGFGLVSLGYVSVASAVLSLLLITVVYLRTCPQITLRPEFVSREFLRKLVSFGLLTTVSVIAYGLTMSGHRLIVGKLVSLEAVAFYAVAATLAVTMERAATAPVLTFWPRFAALDAAGSPVESADLLVRGTRYSALLACGMFGILLVTGPGFIRLWLGPEYERVTPVLVVLCAGFVIATSTQMMGIYLAGVGRQGVQALLAGIEAALGISLSLLLGLELGSLGVALGFTVSVVLLRGCVRTLYVSRMNGISAWRYFSRSLAPAWLIVAAIAGSAYASGLARADYGWIGLCALTATTAITFLVLACLLGIDRSDRRQLLASGRRFLSRRPALGNDGS
ncbi:MAG: oligosaccharide flippase family protein [Myxococcota bacterium]|nr:oligosaccharide flippase family protein [Myxococcota bacterium]